MELSLFLFLVLAVLAILFVLIFWDKAVLKSISYQIAKSAQKSFKDPKFRFDFYKKTLQNFPKLSFLTKFLLKYDFFVQIILNDVLPAINTEFASKENQVQNSELINSILDIIELELRRKDFYGNKDIVSKDQVTEVISGLKR